MRLYAYTTGFCEKCGTTVSARLLQKDDGVWLERLCPTHGNSAARITVDPAWYEDSRQYVKPRQIPFALGAQDFSGCPNSCGLCPEHRQHTCLPIVEITSRCDLRCPVCLKPENGVFGMSAAEFRHALARLMEYEKEIPLLNLSGGEPTLHPEFADFLAICKEHGVMQTSVSTNGLRLHADPALRKLFRDTGTVVSLQFDGFRPGTWTTLRGRDLSVLKQELIALLDQEGIRYSLTATIVKGVNDDEVAAIADFFFASKALSLMFQPVAITGAARARFSEADRMTIDGVIDQLDHSRHINKGDFNPLPCSHPSCFALSYYFQVGEDVFYSLKDFLGRDAYLEVIANRTLPGLDQEGHNAIRERIYSFWSAADSVADNKQVLQRIKAILRELERQRFSPKAAFDIGSTVLRSVFIHGFMDANTFDLTRIMKCCNHYLQPDGRLIPMCAHNVIKNFQGSADSSRGTTSFGKDEAMGTLRGL